MIKTFGVYGSVSSVFSILSYHDNQRYVCWPKSFEGFWPISGSPVMKDGTRDIEPAWCIDGELPIDKVLVSFTLKHWDTEKRENKM